jgi:hypothetical protein
MARQSAGLLLITQSLPIAAVVDDLLLIWATMDADEWINLIWGSVLKVEMVTLGTQSKSISIDE